MTLTLNHGGLVVSQIRQFSAPGCPPTLQGSTGPHRGQTAQKQPRTAPGEPQCVSMALCGRLGAPGTKSGHRSTPPRTLRRRKRTQLGGGPWVEGWARSDGRQRQTTGARFPGCVLQGPGGRIRSTRSSVPPPLMSTSMPVAHLRGRNTTTATNGYKSVGKG